MTESVLQTAEQKKDYFDFVSANCNISKDIALDSNFSNFLNNLNVKAQNVQTSYKAETINASVKSNTSSINKKALDYKPAQNAQTVSKPTATKQSTDKPALKQKTTSSVDNSNSTGSNAKKVQKDTKTTNQTVSTKSKDVTTQVQTDKKDTVKVTINSKTQDTSTKKTDVINSSDVNINTNSNNNSPVDPSPVIFLDETDTEAQTSQVLEDNAIISLAGILNADIQAFKQTEQTDKFSTDEIIEVTDEGDVLTDIVNKISQFVNDDNNNLADDKKDELKNAVDEILNKLQNQKTDKSDNTENDVTFSTLNDETEKTETKDENNTLTSIKDDVKTLIDNLKDAIQTQNRVDNVTVDNTAKEVEVTTDNENLTAVKNSDEKITVQTNKQTQKASIEPHNETKTTVNELKTDSEKTNSLYEKTGSFDNDVADEKIADGSVSTAKNIVSDADLKNDSVEINPLFNSNKAQNDDIQKHIDSFKTEDVKITIDTLKTRFESIDNVNKNILNNSTETPSTTVTNALNEKLNSIDLNNIDIKNTETINNIVDILTQSKQIVSDDETNAKIDEALNQLNKVVFNNDTEVKKVIDEKSDVIIDNTVKTTDKTDVDFKKALNSTDNTKTEQVTVNNTETDSKPADKKAALNNNATELTNSINNVNSTQQKEATDNSTDNNNEKQTSNVKDNVVKVEFKNNLKDGSGIEEAQKETNDEVELNNETEFDAKTLKAAVEQNDTETVDVKEKTQNIQKSIFETEKLGEIMENLDIDFNFSSINESGALSVADEISKMALNESNPLNVNADFKGTVVYDSIGANKLIKAGDFSKALNAKNIAQNLSESDFLNQIGDKLQQLKAAGGQRLTLVLRPNDLGRLSIEMTNNSQGLTTNILAQNDEVRKFIEKNIDTLRQRLTNAGINVNNIQVKTAGQSDGTNYRGNREDLQQNYENQKENFAGNERGGNENHNKRQARESLNKITDLDFKFEKDFGAILNKSLSYGA